MSTFLVSSALQTIALGKKFATTLQSGDVVLLQGEMGAGKTVFAKGICAGLQVNETVVSPTFAIMHEYCGAIFQVYHFDFYRLQDQSEALELGLEEFFQAPNTVCVIEWGERVKDYLPNHCKTVHIVAQNETQREVTIDD